MNISYKEINREYKKLLDAGLELRVTQLKEEGIVELYVVKKGGFGVVFGPWKMSSTTWVTPSQFRYSEPFSFKNDILRLIIDEMNEKFEKEKAA